MEILVLLILFALMWVLLVLPRQRLQREHRRLVAALRVGDDVVTTSGIYGRLTQVEPDVVHVEVAPGVTMRVARLAIGRRAEGSSPEGPGPAAGPGPVRPDPSTRDPGTP